MRVLAFIVAFAVFLYPGVVWGQGSSGISLEHIPEGRLIDVDGVTYRAYTLEEFREIASLDVRFQALRMEHEATMEALSLEREKVSAQGRVIEWQDDFIVFQGDMLESVLEVTDDSMKYLNAASDDLDDSADEVEDAKVSAWHPVWTPSTIGLIVGLVAWGVVESQSD